MKTIKVIENFQGYSKKDGFWMGRNRNKEVEDMEKEIIKLYVEQWDK